MHGPKWPFLLTHGPGVVVVNCWDWFFTLGRAPCTKETLPDFREWCRVTRHPRVFRKLTGCQRTPGFWGVTPALRGYVIVEVWLLVCKRCCVIMSAFWCNY